MDEISYQCWDYDETISIQRAPSSVTRTVQFTHASIRHQVETREKTMDGDKKRWYNILAIHTFVQLLPSLFETLFEKWWGHYSTIAYGIQG